MYRDRENGRRYVPCKHCREPIYFGNAFYEPDVCILVDGVYICGDCIKDYMLDNYGTKLEEEC